MHEKIKAIPRTRNICFLPGLNCTLDRRNGNDRVATRDNQS